MDGRRKGARLKHDCPISEIDGEDILTEHLKGEIMANVRGCDQLWVVRSQISMAEITW